MKDEMRSLEAVSRGRRKDRGLIKKLQRKDGRPRFIRPSAFAVGANRIGSRMPDKAFKEERFTIKGLPDN